MTSSNVSSQFAVRHPSLAEFASLRPIFITGQWRSGTTLLQRLFDDHPELLVYPYEDSILRSYYAGNQHFPGAFLRADLDETLRNRQADDLLYELCRNNKLANALREHPNAEEWKNLFLSEMERHETWSIELVLLVWMYSYFIAEGVSSFTHCAGWVNKTPDNGQLSETILQAFPDAYVLQMIRDPWAVYASVCARHENKYSVYRGKGIRSIVLHFMDLVRTAKEWRASFRGSERAKKNFPQNFVLLRYEDLVLQPQGIIDNLAKRLGIRIDRSLYRPTLRGKDWIRNTSFPNASEENVVHAQSARAPRISLNYFQELIFRYYTEKGCGELGYW